MNTNSTIPSQVAWLGLGVLATAFAMPAISTVPVVAQEEGTDEARASMSLVRSVEVPSARPLEAGEAPELVGIDTYVDWDLGTATYVHQEGGVSALPLRPNWDFSVVVTSDEGLFSLAIQRSTGLSFFLSDAVWIPIEEPDGEGLLVGDYDVAADIVDGAAYVMRFDRFSGRSWLLEDDTWESLSGNLVGWPDSNSASEGAGSKR